MNLATALPLLLGVLGAGAVLSSRKLPCEGRSSRQATASEGGFSVPGSVPTFVSRGAKATP